MLPTSPAVKVCQAPSPGGGSEWANLRSPAAVNGHAAQWVVSHAQTSRACPPVRMLAECRQGRRGRGRGVVHPQVLVMPVVRVFTAGKCMHKPCRHPRSRRCRQGRNSHHAYVVKKDKGGQAHGAATARQAGSRGKGRPRAYAEAGVRQSVQQEQPARCCIPNHRPVPSRRPL